MSSLDPGFTMTPIFELNASTVRTLRNLGGACASQFSTCERGGQQARGCWWQLWAVEAAEGAARDPACAPPYGGVGALDQRQPKVWLVACVLQL